MSSVANMFGVCELADIPESGKLVEWVLPKQNIGIEIEAERKAGTNFADNLYYWDQKGDGSLQNGYEYVLKSPLKGNELATAITEFFDNCTVQRSTTSGTHIHLDMREKTTDMGVVQAMAAIICCTEPAIFGMFGEGREWSGYTNRLDTLPNEVLASVFDEQSADRFVRTFRPSEREYKYYGFNMLPLGRFGSVEFRYFPTATNPEELVEWIQFCQSVKAAGVSIGSLSSFKQYVQGEPQWEDFLNKFFPPWAEKMKELLPYVEVRRRYRAARAVSRTTPAVQARLTPRPPAPTTPSTSKSKKFRKFYAIKVKDKDGRSRIAYTKEDVRALQPIVFLGPHDIIGMVPPGGFFYETGSLHQRSQAGFGFNTIFHVGSRQVEVERYLNREEVEGFKHAATTWMNNPTGAPPGEYLEQMKRALTQYINMLDRYYDMPQPADSDGGVADAGAYNIDVTISPGEPAPTYYSTTDEEDEL